MYFPKQSPWKSLFPSRWGGDKNRFSRLSKIDIKEVKVEEEIEEVTSILLTVLNGTSFSGQLQIFSDRQQ